MSAPPRLVEVEGRVPYASNATFLARDRAGARWVYKPDRGERPLHDFPTGSLARRETLTYEVSAAMGLDLVPDTFLVDGPLGPGSAQRWLEEDETFDPRALLTPALAEELWGFAVLDLVCNNADRKLGHLLREKGSGRMWAIDHGLTFHAEDKLRTVLWGFAGRPIPAPLVEALRSLEERLAEGLGRRVRRLLSQREAQALRARVMALRVDPVHPSPPTDRPALPWPVW